MSWDSKVLWSEGLFLQPHHFQQSDRYLESLINGLARRVGPYLWGVTSLEIDEEVLKVGQFALKSATGLTQDGTVFVCHLVRIIHRLWMCLTGSRTVSSTCRFRNAGRGPKRSI